MPRKRKEAVPTLMKLPQTTRAMAEIVGDGDRTAGVERLFAQLPVFYRVKLLLEGMLQDDEVPENWRSLIEPELDALTALELERVHDEAIAEGVIKVGESWIA